MLGAVAGGGPRLGNWPKVPFGDLVLAFPDKLELEGTEVVIATFPTDDWTEVFACARFGGWNECPGPQGHVAAFRHSTARYGLALVGMSHDTLYLRAQRKPATREEALELAREQYEYTAPASWIRAFRCANWRLV